MPEEAAGLKTSAEAGRVLTTKERAKKLNIKGRKGFKPREKNAMEKYGDQLKTLLKNKERLVASEVGDGLNKYQFQIFKL